MANEHIDALSRSRAKLIEQRRALVKRDGTSDRNEGFAERIVAIQAALAATDQAIAEEEEFAENNPSSRGQVAAA